MNRKQWRAFQARGEIPKMTDEGKRLMAMKIGDTYLRPWSDERRPDGPGEIQVQGMHFKLEPQQSGLLFTRIS